MKKIFYTLALAAIAFTACQKPSYTISGTVEEGVEDGRKVYLLNSGCAYPYKIADSAVVKDGKFTFGGREDIPQICVLQVPTRGSSDKIVPFILENGHIFINTEKDIVAGTRNNNTFQAHKDSIKSYEIAYLESLKRLQNDSTLTEDQKEIRKEIEMYKRVKKEISLFRNTIEADTVNTATNDPISSIYSLVIAIDSIQNSGKP
jgi:hypothetical protein